MEFQDPVGVLTPVDLAKFCASRGRPRPSRCVYRGGRGRCVVYDLAFPDAATALWVELAPGVLGSGLERERAALAALGDAVPALPPLETVPAPMRSWTAALRPVVDGVPAFEWLARGLGDWPLLAYAVGRAVDGLAGIPLPAHGLAIEGTAFAASAASWRAGWEGYVAALVQRARTTGVDMGPHTRRLADAIAHRVAALDRATSWTLVHGDLGPQSLEVLPKAGKAVGALVGGWEEAHAGDPLVEVGALLGLNADWLAPVLAGVGEERARGWLAPEALARIEVYHMTWCLAQLCAVGDHLAFDHRLERLGALAGMRRQALRALEPGYCRARLEDAIGRADRGEWAVAPEPVDPIEAHLHVALGAVAAKAVPAPDAAAALAAGLLARRVGAEAARASLAIGRATARVRQAAPGPPTAIGDLDAWRDGVTARVTGVWAAALWWTGLLAVAEVEGHVSDACRRGLEGLVDAPSDADVPEATGAVVGLGAVHGLRDLLGRPDLLEDLRRACVDALGPAEAGEALGPERVEALLKQRLDLDVLRLRPLVLLALWTLHGRETVPAGILARTVSQGP